MSATLDSGCMPVKHIASYSFGKDSLATVLLANKHGEPLDEVVYCEVMFDKGICLQVKSPEGLKRAWYGHFQSVGAALSREIVKRVPFTAI